jgi:2-oxoglutarate dehydrogenase E1 component
MGPSTSFQPIIAYQNIEKVAESEAVIITSGKFVYDIEQILLEKKSQKTVLLAIEELYPFPEAKLSGLLAALPKTAQCYWVQEENFNGGAFQFAENRINRVLGEHGLKEVRYVGRRAVAATAVGSSELHKR